MVMKASVQGCGLSSVRGGRCEIEDKSINDGLLVLYAIHVCCVSSRRNGPQGLSTRGLGCQGWKVHRKFYYV